VLLNLIINAEQAMLGRTAAGRWCFEAARLRQRRRDARVNDDGPGVPEDVQPKIFDPFLHDEGSG
jgi:signal transduction histidine kinase